MESLSNFFCNKAIKRSDMNTPQISILTCGGTIDKVYFDAKSEYEVGEPQIQAILQRANVSFDYTIESVVKKDSLEMTDADRTQLHHLVATSMATHFLVTHGTDTMIETAKYLYDIAGKTIVFTGAMVPARFHETDAVFNVGCAVIALQTLPNGVYVVVNGRVFDPHTTRKNVAASVFEAVGSAS